MFVRLKRSVRDGHAYEYLQLVRSYRDDGQVRQQVLATLGRRDVLTASGQLDGLLKSLGRFSTNLRVVDAVRSSGLQARSAKSWGPTLVFGRLWERQGLPEELRRLSEDRRFRFDVERVTFVMALQRLCYPGSDLQGSGWVKTVEAPGFETIELQHFYRTCGFLFDVRQDLERQLFFRDRDLFSMQLDFIHPGKPVENAYIESFNGRFRSECLNAHWFQSIADARVAVESWRQEYNGFRPHTSLNHQTPEEFLRQYCQVGPCENPGILTL
jgi:putative transposase